MDYKFQICNTHPHNYLIEILVDAGLVGFIIIYMAFAIVLVADRGHGRAAVGRIAKCVHVGPGIGRDTQASSLDPKAPETAAPAPVA